jgi:hypothetical protein
MIQPWGDPPQAEGPVRSSGFVGPAAPWRVAPSLDRLLAEVNALAPDRDRSSDGSIGDARHANHPSGHNPDESGHPEDVDTDHRNEVRARDFDTDLNRPGITMEMVAQYLVQRSRTGRITWIKYIIFDRRIWSASDGWVTRAYAGGNPHREHMHVSSKPDAVSESDTRPMRLVSSLRELAYGRVDRLAVRRLTGSTKAGATFYTRGIVTVGWSTSTASSFIRGFDVLVDGRRAASVRGGHRTARLRLAPGRYSVQVRALHRSGRSTLTRVYPLVADRQAPAFVRKPVVALRRGAMRSTVPVSLGWQASDPGGVRSVTLRSPATARFDAGRTGWLTGAAHGTSTTWSLRATDRSGNVTDDTVTRTPVVLPETVAVRTGTWSTSTDPAHVGAAALRSSTPGAALTWTFTGRGASLVFSRTARSGRVVVTVDGRTAATVDLRSAAPAHRQVVWASNWSSSGTHTVTVTAADAAGHIISDGLVYLR